MIDIVNNDYGVDVYI